MYTGDGKVSEGQPRSHKSKAEKSKKGVTSTRIRLLELELARMRHDEHALLEALKMSEAGADLHARLAGNREIGRAHV